MTDESHTFVGTKVYAIGLDIAYDCFWPIVCILETYLTRLLRNVCDGPAYRTPLQGNGSELCQRKDFFNHVP